MCVTSSAREFQWRIDCREKKKEEPPTSLIIFSLLETLSTNPPKRKNNNKQTSPDSRLVYFCHFSSHESPHFPGCSSKKRERKREREAEIKIPARVARCHHFIFETCPNLFLDHKFPVVSENTTTMSWVGEGGDLSITKMHFTWQPWQGGGKKHLFFPPHQPFLYCLFCYGERERAEQNVSEALQRTKKKEKKEQLHPLLSQHKRNFQLCYFSKKIKNNGLTTTYFSERQRNANILFVCLSWSSLVSLNTKKSMAAILWTLGSLQAFQAAFPVASILHPPSSILQKQKATKLCQVFPDLSSWETLDART